MISPIVSVGVDLGGTWIRLGAYESGRKIRSHRDTAISREQLPLFLRRCFRRWKIHPRHLAVGSRGVWTPIERRRLTGALQGLARRVAVMSDVEAAWLAAFGLEKRGILVIAGTGSIAYGRDRQGHIARAGGLGPLLGDEGSAFWIGREWLKRKRATRTLLRMSRFPQTAVRRTAALAPSVIRQAQRGHKIARDIIRLAQRHLAELAWQTARSLHWDHPAVPLSGAGSVLENAWFQDGFRAALNGAGDSFRWEWTLPTMDPVTALATYA